MDPDSNRLHVSVTDGRGRQVRDGGLGRWLASVAPARARGVVAVALASDAQVRALNSRYRRQDRPTDVLSFPAFAEAPADRPAFAEAPADRPAFAKQSPRLRPGSGGQAELGDIVIARGVARRQAREAGHSEQTELRVLALHGLLHLLGYDHHRRDDRGRMARAEARLRRRGGLRAGLIERADGGGAPRRMPI